MTIDELKNLIQAEDVELIRFYGNADTSGKMVWTIAVYGKPSVYAFGHCVTNSSRDKENKDYTSLDRAYNAIKASGYKGRFEVDDGSIFAHNVPH
ncbi:hypothetical protein A1353_24150 [Methylomonas methanica]|uniref:Uncharacterized protein n=1 Tax=Methylomonas methanica TaxID=421 RepID=A0A177LTH8_METMH|nr:hypothetical protein [Methylomonas methanica]OAH96282.1 hypothetical protein A1353_24150 [Methylomonas methanica]